MKDQRNSDFFRYLLVSKLNSFNYSLVRRNFQELLPSSFNSEVKARSFSKRKTHSTKFQYNKFAEVNTQESEVILITLKIRKYVFVQKVIPCTAQKLIRFFDFTDPLIYYCFLILMLNNVLPKVQPRPLQISKMESLATKTVSYYCCNLSFFDVSVVLVTVLFTMSGKMHLLAYPKSCE